MAHLHKRLHPKPDDSYFKYSDCSDKTEWDETPWPYEFYVYAGAIHRDDNGIDIVEFYARITAWLEPLDSLAYHLGRLQTWPGSPGEYRTFCVDFATKADAMRFKLEFC